METYQLETFEAYKIYGTTHNVKTNLCNKTWLRLNDKNRHEVLIFNENGTLIISCNGLATNNTWKYIQFDNYLVINSPQQTYLLHPFFFNNGIVVALQLDGTKNYSFLIAEHNTQQFAPQNMTQLLDYFKELDKNFQQKKEKIATLSSDYKRKEEVANEAWSIVEERWRRKPIYENIHFIYAPNSAAAVLNFLLGLAIGVFLSYKFLQVSKWYWLILFIFTHIAMGSISHAVAEGIQKSNARSDINSLYRESHLGSFLYIIALIPAFFICNFYSLSYWWMLPMTVFASLILELPLLPFTLQIRKHNMEIERENEKLKKIYGII